MQRGRQCQPNKRTSESWSVWMVHPARIRQSNGPRAMRRCATLRSAWCRSCPGNNRPGRVGIWYSRFQEAQKREIVEHSYLVAQAHQIVEQAHKVALEASSSGRAAQITGEVLHGQIVPTLANISRQVAMVVLGYRGQGAVAGALLGSVSSSLVRHAHGPVAVIPEEPRPARPPHAPVVVGIDGSPTSGLAAEIAFDEASRRGVDLVALHAWSDMGPSTFLGSIGRRSNGETSKTSRRKCSPGV